MIFLCVNNKLNKERLVLLVFNNEKENYVKRPVFLLFVGLVLGEAAAIFLNRIGFFVMALFLLIFMIILYIIIKKRQGLFFVYGVLFFAFFLIGGISFYRAKYFDALDIQLDKKELKGTLTGQVEFVKQTLEKEYQITLRDAFFLEQGNKRDLKGIQAKDEKQVEMQLIQKKLDRQYTLEKKQGNTCKRLKDYSSNRQYKLRKKQWNIRKTSEDYRLDRQYKLRKKCRVLKIPVSVGKVYAGDWILCTGKLKVIEGPTNPGQFDSKTYYNSLGIRYHFFGEKLVRKRETPLSIYRLAGLAREKIDAAYQKILSVEDYGILKAMFLGDKTDLSREQKDLYQDSGAAHLLAVSGLHVSIVGGLLFRALRKRGCSYAFSCIAGSLVLIFYAVMTGFGNSVFRAATMFLCYMVSQYFGAEYDLISSMSLAGIIMLLDSPWRLLESGCILSFVAIFSIGMLLPYAKELEEKRRKKELIAGEFPIEKKWQKTIRQAFFANLILSMAITPLLLRFYYQWSPYSIFINLIVIPAMSPLLLSAVVGGVSGIFSQLVGFFCCVPAVALLRSFDGIFHLVSKIPGSVVVTGCPAWWKIGLIYILELCFFVFWYYRLWSGSLILALILVAGTFFRPTRSLKITMLDVGQGECIFLQMPTGQTILIDGGSTSKKHIADSIIIPALKYYGTDHLDYVIITHTDEDHISGIRELLEKKYPVKNVVFPDVVSIDGEKNVVDTVLTDKQQKALDMILIDRKQGSVDTLSIGKEQKNVFESEENISRMNLKKQDTVMTTKDIINDIEKKKYSIIKMHRGDRMRFGQVTISCLHPQKGWKQEDVNSGSLVLQLSYNDFMMLFTGDLNGEQEPLLSSTAIPITPIDILKTAHHGSKNSTTEAFLKTFHPKTAILSAGKNNLYGHPHKETLKRLQKNGADIYGTLWRGAIIIESNGQKYEINYFTKE